MMLLALTLLLWLMGFVVLARIRSCEGLNNGGEASATRLTVVVPARNEESNLPKLLQSIAAQSVHPREILVVDDASTDRTSEMARQYGARVITSEPLPEGWRGKTWACHQGAQAASGDLLLFLDADTWFEPEGLRRVLAEFEAARVGALSVAPHHAVRLPHEQLSAFFNLVMLAGTGAFTLLEDRLAPGGMFGQFLLIDRAAYGRAGGHAAVKGRILENFHFAGQLRSHGVALRCRGGRGTFSFRMYPEGLKDLIDGWSKGFSSGAGRTPLPLLLFIIAWTTGLMLAPTMLLLSGDRWTWLAVCGLCVGQVAWMLRRTGTFHWSVALLYPVPLMFFFAVFGRSAWRAGRGREVSWKGRQIRAD